MFALSHASRRSSSSVLLNYQYSHVMQTTHNAICINLSIIWASVTMPMDWKDAIEPSCYLRMAQRIMLLTCSFLDCAESLLVFLAMSCSFGNCTFESNFMKQPDFHTKCSHASEIKYMSSSK